MDKQHILAEIKRTASANGGRPLGRERFYNETGIVESDWLGKYWARWSDAVRESGFEPNQLQGPLDEDAAIEKFISLMRELRKFPTANELKLKARRTPGFPWPTTYARLGSKQKLAERIEGYCREREGYDDVRALCSSIAGSVPDIVVDDAEAHGEIGLVYLLKSGQYYKIGRSNSVGRRQYELAIQLPERATTVHAIRTDDPNGIEAYWHKRFEDKRKNGEWFELDREDVRAFKRRKFM